MSSIPERDTVLEEFTRIGMFRKSDYPEMEYQWDLDTAPLGWLEVETIAVKKRMSTFGEFAHVVGIPAEGWRNDKDSYRCFPIYGQAITVPEFLSLEHDEQVRCVDVEQSSGPTLRVSTAF